MGDVRVERMAKTLVHYSLELKAGDFFIIRGSEATAPLMRAVYREAIEIGAHPEAMVSLDGIPEIFLKYAGDSQLAFVSPLQKLAMERCDALLSIRGDYNTRSLSGVDPTRQARRSKAMGEVNKIFMERSATGALRWCATQFPTHADAQEANMSLEEYSDFVYDACRLNEEDSVGAWRDVHTHQERLVQVMSQLDTLRIIGEGTDLTLRVGGRTWINCSGRANFPDGEIFTGPVEDSANGHVRFSFPGIYAGKEIEDIQLTFENGRVVNAQAARGEALLQALLASDEGASYLGELGIGTNYNIDRVTRNMLFDEKIGGTVHLAIGAGYPESGSTNTSGVHWDMLCDLRSGGEIHGDGNVIYKDGAFLI